MNSSSAASKMTKAHGRRPSKNRMRDHLSGWLFVLPLLVVFLVFIGIPVFRTVFYLGFTDYNLMKDPGLGWAFQLLKSCLPRTLTRQTCGAPPFGFPCI